MKYLGNSFREASFLSVVHYMLEHALRSLKILKFKHQMCSYNDIVSDFTNIEVNDNVTLHHLINS